MGELREDRVPITKHNWGGSRSMILMFRATASRLHVDKYLVSSHKLSLHFETVKERRRVRDGMIARL